MASLKHAFELKASRLWELDPGLLHLKQAFKTVVTIVVVLVGLRHTPAYICLLGGIIVGFSMQGIVAKSFRAQCLQIVVLDVIYVVAFLLGLSVNTSVIGRALVLVFVGFFANYMRRFGLQRSPAPLMGWCICFFGATLALPEMSEVLHYADVLLGALLISALANVLIFPRNDWQLLISNSNHFFRIYARGMREIGAFRQPTRRREFSQINFVKIDAKLSHVLWNSQSILKGLGFTMRNDPINASIMQQYAFAHVFHLITDAYRILFQFNHRLPIIVQHDLKKILNQYHAIFHTMRMHKNGTLRVTKQITLPDVERVLVDMPLDEPQLILLLLNLKLSFHLLNQYLKPYHEVIS